ncbi:MAG: hypothetical protein JO023_17970 [Chloroflexi bacterium]|nr:hypothetical protein [Chloroflexota bacterium]
MFVAFCLMTLIVTYPETLPFLLATAGLFVLIEFVRFKRPATTLIVIGVAGAGLALVGLNAYVIDVAHYMAFALGVGQGTVDLQTTRFPYFLIPSGLSYLWGFAPIAGGALSEPLLSISIVVGAVLLAVTVYAGVRLSARGAAVAMMTLVMLVLAARLFVLRSDFGLFKLAMFLQPFVLGTLVLWWWGTAPRMAARVLPLLVLGAAGLFAQTTYVDASRGYSSAFVEVPHATPLRVNRQFQQFLQTRPPSPLVLDTSNMVLAKFEAQLAVGTPSAFVSQDYFTVARALPDYVNSSLRSLGDPVLAALAASQIHQQFQLLDSARPAAEDDFSINTIGQGDEQGDHCGTLIRTPAGLTPFNRRSQDLLVTGAFVASACDAVANHLIFTDSALGQNYYVYPPTNIAFYPLEPDPMYSGKTMSGIGRYVLFQVINPSRPLRLVLDMTDTFQSDGDNHLPPASAIGVTRELFPFTGRGSARVFSPVLQPQAIDGRYYVAIDMDVDGKRITDNRQGLMRLYGADVPLDGRHLVGFVRDVSAVSDTQYQQMSAPAAIAQFPNDLANPELEYSGIYEDGWISEDSFVVLNRNAPDAQLVVRGTVPGVNDPAFQEELHVRVDGQEVLQRELGTGDFDVNVGLPDANTGSRRIELYFSTSQSLSAPDTRQVSGLLHYLGFQ